MFRIVQSGNALPISYPVDASAEFQPGMIAQLGVLGNNIVCGVSDGTVPLGIIDDIKVRAFTAPSIDERIIVTAPMVSTNGQGELITPIDVMKELKNPNIVQNSFVSNPLDVVLNARNGTITFPAGTVLNLDQDGDGAPDSLTTVVNYSYQVPNVPGDDSTLASGRVTVWFQRMIFTTDQFETNQRYPVNSNLFVTEGGLLTTRQADPTYPGVAIVTGSPNAIAGQLEAMWI